MKGQSALSLPGYRGLSYSAKTISKAGCLPEYKPEGLQHSGLKGEMPLLLLKQPVSLPC